MFKTALFFIVFVAYTAQAQTILPTQHKPKVITSLAEFEPLLHNTKPDAAVIVHFWATWCPQCMKELPRAIAALNRSEKKGIRTVLISLDAAQNAGHVQKVARKAGYTLPSYILSVDADPIVKRVGDGSWHGDLPATFSFWKGQRSGSHIGALPLNLKTELILLLDKPY